MPTAGALGQVDERYPLRAGVGIRPISQIPPAPMPRFSKLVPSSRWSPPWINRIGMLFPASIMEVNGVESMAWRGMVIVVVPIMDKFAKPLVMFGNFW